MKMTRREVLATKRKLESKLSEDKLAEASPIIEEKLASARLSPDPEMLKETLRTKRSVRRVNYKEIVDNERRYQKSLESKTTPKKLIKAAAQAAFIMGQPISQIALQYNLEMAEVASWRDTLITAGAIGRRDRLSDILMVYIEQEIKSLIAISIVTSDEDWIRDQHAGELATYIAIKSDRLFQVLQAFGRTVDSREAYIAQLEEVVNEDSA